MKILDRLFRAKTRAARRPDVSFLKEQIASDIKLFSSIRGRAALLKPGAAVVMNHRYETFLTNDASTIANRKEIIAVVNIKDLTSYEQVMLIQGEDLRGPAGTAIIHGLAAQSATELLRQAVGAGRSALPQGSPGGFPSQHAPRDHYHR